MPAPILPALGAILARVGMAIVGGARVAGTAAGRIAGTTLAKRAVTNAATKQAGRFATRAAVRAERATISKSAAWKVQKQVSKSSVLGRRPPNVQNSIQQQQQSQQSPLARYIKRKLVKTVNRTKRGFRQRIKSFAEATGTNIGSKAKNVWKSYKKYANSFQTVANQGSGSSPDSSSQATQPAVSSHSQGVPPEGSTPVGGATESAGANAAASQSSANRKQAMQELDDAISKLKQSVVRMATLLLFPPALVLTFTSSIKRIADANLSVLRERSPFSGRIANAVTKYDVAQNRRDFKTAAATAATSEAFTRSLNELANAMQPFKDFSINVFNSSLTALVKLATFSAGLFQTFLPFLKTIYEKIAGPLPIVAPNRGPLETALGNPRWKKKPPVPGF